MKTLLKLAFAVAIAYVLLEANRKRSRAVPTLRPMRDAEPLAPEPLRDQDLNIAQNAPF